MAECIFCRIARGEAARHLVVYEDEQVAAFMNRGHQIVSGHVLLIPKRHVETLYDLDDDLAAWILPVAARIARAVKAEFAADGVNLLQNNEVAAGQEIAHFHLHIIPRRWGDELWKRLRQPEEVPKDHLARLAARLRQRLTASESVPERS